MVNSRITFGQLDAALEHLGFRKEVVEGSHVNYWHPDWKTPYMAQLHKPKDLVPNFVLAGTRSQMEHLGIVASSDFDAMLQSTAGTGKSAVG